jgi:O-antigen ligase
VRATRGTPPAGAAGASPPAAPYGFSFALFLLANAALFVRPSDVFPSLEGLEFYRYLLIGCLLVGFPAVLDYLGKARVDSRPIDVCLFLLFPLILLSSLASGGIEVGWDQGVTYAKILVYYLLLVSLVTTPWRIRMFLGCVVVYTAMVTILAALDFYKVIAIPRPLLDTGKVIYLDPDRMYGPGIFQDPNDICVLIATSLMFLLGLMSDRRVGVARWLWLLPLGVFAFGFFLTRSRGGMLALVAGLGIAIRLRHGWGRAIVLGVLGLPVLVALTVMRGGPQREMTVSSGTGQERIQLWSDGLVMFRANPLFGVGPENFRMEAGHVAHNSYLQTFSELGFVAGILFLGATFVAVSGLYRLRRPVAAAGRPVVPQFVDTDLQQIYPYITGAILAYATGMLTLTLTPLVTTYGFLGLAGLFLSLTVTRPSVPRDRFDALLLVKFVVLSVFYLAAVFAFVRLNYRF